jgi:hypothetical protein
MNTKGIKFLAVLAVMVMAFAAIIALAPADEKSDAVVVYFNDSNVVRDPTVIDQTVTINKFYISEDAVVKIKDLQNIADPDDEGVIFYVQNGVELELDFKERAASEEPGDEPTVEMQITIYTVTADQQRITTSTVDIDSNKNVRQQSGRVEGKIVLEDTMFSFKGENKQNVVYVALMPDTVKTITTSGPVFTTNVTTGSNYAYISAGERLADAAVGNKVAIASGQSIETASDLTATLNFGVSFFDKKNDDHDEMYTYYAIGANAGTIVVEADDIVTIVNGSVTVNNDSATVKATAVKQIAKTKTAAAIPATLTYGGENQIDIAGGMSSGSMTVSGKVLFADSFVNKATVTLNASADVQENSAMTVTGTLILKNDASKIEKLAITGTGFVVAENTKLWSYEQGTYAVLTFANNGEDDFFTGQFDVTAINKKADVEDAFSTATIERDQTFLMVGDTIVANQFTIKGVLIIQEGVTLTITETNEYGAAITVMEQYAQIINYGTIVIKTNKPYVPPTDQNATTGAEPLPIGLHVKGGYVQNYGTITAVSLSTVPANTPTFVVDYVDEENDDSVALGYGFVNNGTISVGKYDTVSLDAKFTNDVLGSMSIGGTFYGDSLVNSGIITLNGAKISQNLTVAMSNKATFAVTSADLTGGVSVTVNNNSAKNAITFTAPGDSSSADKVRINGITVTDAGSKSLGYKLDLSGNIGTSIPSSFTDGKVTIITEGSIDVTGTATINKGYQLDLTKATILSVPGEFTITKDVVLKAGDASKLTMFVSGVVTDASATEVLSKSNYIAAKVIVPSVATIYTTLKDAIETATELSIAQVDVGGDKASGMFITVVDDLVIPEGLTVDGKYLVVDKKASIIVESGAYFGIVDVLIEDGMIAAADVNSINYQKIVADVKEEDDSSTAAVCMSLEVALMLATEGDVIELANTFYAADADLVIPAGVTVDATALDTTDFVLVNSNLTVDGKLIVGDFAFIATTDDTIGITVNGFIYDKCAGGKCFVNWWYTPFGVSYFVTDDNDDTWYVLTTIENIQPAINDADNAEVTVEGDAVLDELTVSGRDDMPATVNFNGNVNIGVINIDDTALVFTDGKEITATIKDAVGSITIIGAYSDDDLTIYSMDDEGVYMAGTVIDKPKNKPSVSTYSITFEGITGMNGTVKTAIDWTNTEKTPVILFAGETTVIGKKAKISTDDEHTNDGLATITGTLYVDNNAKLAINTNVQILGALVAADRTEDANPGSIDTFGNIFIGMSVTDIYDLDYYPYYDELAAGAIVSGKITLAAGHFIYVAPAAVVDPAIVDDLDTMGVYVDDELWFSLYAYATDEFTLEGLTIPMFNADLAIILDDYDGVVDADTYAGTNIIDTDEQRTLSEYGNVYIVLDYNIFEVKIKTDGSVKAVYIDGILMETGNVANIFTMMNVAAGTHEVSVEAATGYDADKCVLYTEMGTILPNMGFTFTELDVTEYDYIIVDEEPVKIPVVVYNINGTEIQPEPVPPTPEEESQWTITTILLVILVVLIAIMAVIVALRLNRS